MAGVTETAAAVRPGVKVSGSRSGPCFGFSFSQVEYETSMDFRAGPGGPRPIGLDYKLRVRGS